MDCSKFTYDFKKYELVYGKNLNAGEAYVTFIGIVTKCTEDRVALSIVWCEHIERMGCKPWFVGMEIEYYTKKSYCWNNLQFYSNVRRIGDASFPYDIPGHYPAGGVCFESGRAQFESAKERGKIASRKQFIDLLDYVKENVENGTFPFISDAIISFYKTFGWSDYGNMFIQGVHADGREWRDKNITKFAQPLIFI